MRTLTAVGPYSGPAPTLSISSGRGVVDVEAKQVHVAFRDTDGDRTRLLQAWFDLDEVREAIDAATPTVRVMREPA